MRNARTLTQDDNRATADSNETGESDIEEYDSDAIDSVAGGGEKMSHVISFLRSLIQMRKMAMIGQMPHAQGEP